MNAMSFVLVVCLLVAPATSMPNLWAYRQVLCNSDRFISLQKFLSCGPQLISNQLHSFGNMEIAKPNEALHHHHMHMMPPLPVFSQLSQALPQSIQSDKQHQAIIMKNPKKHEFDKKENRLVIISVENGPKKWTGKGQRARIYIPLDLDLNDIGQGKSQYDKEMLGERHETIKFENKNQANKPNLNKARVGTRMVGSQSRDQLPQQSMLNDFLILPDHFFGIDHREKQEIYEKPSYLSNEMAPVDERMVIDLMKQNLIRPTLSRRVDNEWDAVTSENVLYIRTDRP